MLLYQVVQIWFNTWKSLSDKVLAQNSKIGKENIRALARNQHKAALYLQLALRFSKNTMETLSLYQTSVDLFANAISTESSCEIVRIPYKDERTNSFLHGYLCLTSPSAPIIIALNGYDGTAELTYHELAASAMSHGYNVLIVEGPGQGYTVRFNFLYFRPDWEFVVNQVINFLETQFSPLNNKLILWGRSFGGYLAPRAFSFIPSIDILVADGGISDFFQAIFCSLPTSLQTLYYTDPSNFDSILINISSEILSLQFLLNYGYLGFNTSTPSQLFTSFQDYWQDNNLVGIGNRPVIVNNPSLDNLMQNQSNIFWSMLPRPLSNFSTLVQMDPIFGTSLHCSVGSTDTDEIYYAVLDKILQNNRLNQNL